MGNRALLLGAAAALVCAGCANPITVDPDTHLRLVKVPAGRFLMGSPASEPGRGLDEVQHEVTLSHEFYLGQDEVTQDEWASVMGARPSQHAGCGGCPVERVNFFDVQQFVAALTARSTRFRYRLPTEAEWEYACRAGTTTAFSTGATITIAQANYNGTNPPSLNPGRDNRAMTTPVGTFPANPWALRDMHGNVWEWVEDWYGPYPATPVVGPAGPPSGEKHVIRGGSWAFWADSARCASRYTHAPIDLGFSLGARVAATRK